MGCDIVPATVRRDERVRLFRPPAPRLVGTNATVGLQDSIDHRPGGLDRVLPGEERPVAGHGVGQEPLVRRLLARLMIDEVELPLVADELLADALDASGEGDGGVGGEPEAQIVGPAVRRR